ncbi:UbiX family flavin prenyltransferase [Streptomyces silvisoli]|uniref:Flavin prenyltransferase UbiX n=1 Tax=Streptomyces silvisoli TaxID=3034235 RepID=A0ABT5ZVL4_9ACTN|nr:UbiX family flavin prenyltransferase [Streptomyces silvisoli]MDF3293863.1 UbiX family flavin prenyltransferase [Streptomyces silvisoli]
MRLIVAITGTTGTALGVRLLQRLREIGSIETHLILSRWPRATLEPEIPYSVGQVRELADVTYGPADQAAPILSGILSGSFLADGMIVIPCSNEALAVVRAGYASDLVTRATDVVIKERRRLVLVTRETPLSAIHLENTLELARLWVTTMPPTPAHYTRPQDIDDVVDNFVGRVLDQFGPEVGPDSAEVPRWAGLPTKSPLSPG